MGEGGKKPQSHLELGGPAGFQESPFCSRAWPAADPVLETPPPGVFLV